MGRPFIRAHLTFCIAICAFWLTSACCQEAAKQPKLSSEVERCRRINNEHMRVHRLEQINSKAAPVPQQQPTASGTWQLARTPNPSGGPDSISITKITNPTPSEQDVAGLMLRCAEGASTDRSSRTPATAKPSRSDCRGGRNDDRVHRKPKRSWSTQKSHSLGPSVPIRAADTEQNDPSVMLRCRVGSISCGRR
jgi:hypothetical protein